MSLTFRDDYNIVVVDKGFPQHFSIEKHICRRAGILISLTNSVSGRSMLKTLERYQKCNYGAPEPNTMSAQEALVIFVEHVDIFQCCLVVRSKDRDLNLA